MFDEEFDADRSLFDPVNLDTDFTTKVIYRINFLNLVCNISEVTDNC